MSTLFVVMKNGEPVCPATEYSQEAAAALLAKNGGNGNAAPATRPSKPLVIGSLTIMPAVVETPDHDPETQILVGRYREIKDDVVRYFYKVEPKPEELEEDVAE